MALTKVTGSVIKDSVSLSGNVSVGGTLTYQDVTNVDALGIGTFRTGIKVLAGQVDVGSNIKLGNAGVITATSFSGVMSGTTGSFSGQVNVGSNIKLGTAGVVTATSFVGSGANLTSLPAQATIANNADNRVITGGSGVNLNGEANLTFDGTNLTLQGGKIYGEDNASNSLHLQSTSGNNNHSRIEIGTIQSSDNGGIHFYTAGSSAATRYMTLKGTSGNLGIGADNPTKKLTVQAGSNNTDIALFTGNDLNRGLLISTIAANSQNDMGVVYHAHGQHGGSYLGEHIFKTNNAERLRIESDGDILFLGGTLRIKDSGNSAQRGAIYGDASSFHINAGVNNLIAYSAGTERLRIGSSGQIGLSGANYGTSGQVLTSQGSGSAVQWATPASNYKITTGSVINTGNSTSETITGIPSDAVKVELLFYNLRTTATGIMAMRAGAASTIDSQTWFSAHTYGVQTNNTNSDMKTSAWTSRFQMPHEDFQGSQNRRTGIFTFTKHIGGTDIWYCVMDMINSETGGSASARNLINKGYIDMGASGFDRIKIFTYSNEVNIEYNGKMQLKYYQVV